MERLLTLSLRYRFFTLVALILVTGAGLYSLGERSPRGRRQMGGDHSGRDPLTSRYVPGSSCNH